MGARRDKHWRPTVWTSVKVSAGPFVGYLGITWGYYPGDVG